MEQESKVVSISTEWLQNNSLRALKQRRRDRIYMYRREMATVLGPNVNPKDQRELINWILCRAKAEGFTEKDLRFSGGGWT